MSLRHPTEQVLMRRLLSVPMLHTQADLGSMAGLLRQEYTERYGAERWDEHARALAALWGDLREQVLTRLAGIPRVRVFQDGLPVCGREMEIVREVAAAGSQNYRLVLDLVDQGATVEGSEDPGLLRQELELLRNLAAVRDPAARSDIAGQIAQEQERLLEARDRYVAARIDRTLGAGETGVLFMGLKHQVERYLDPDIAVEYVMPQDPAAARQARASGKKESC